jgi:hypothetical protein
MDKIVLVKGILPPTVIACPDPKDVLFSMKHKRDRRQEGNQELKRLIERDYLAFHASPARSQQRDNIIRNVIKEISTSWKGRFLVWNDEMLWWDQLTPISSDPLGSDESCLPSPDVETKIRKKFNSKGKQHEYS